MLFDFFQTVLKVVALLDQRVRWSGLLSVKLFQNQSALSAGSMRVVISVNIFYYFIMMCNGETIKHSYAIKEELHWLKNVSSPFRMRLSLPRFCTTAMFPAKPLCLSRISWPKQTDDVVLALLQSWPGSGYFLFSF